jgi:hypothetical protein
VQVNNSIAENISEVLFMRKRNHKHIVLVALCALFFIGAVTVQAATYYVATTGNDSYPGTQSQPFRTIKKGVSALRAGDTLYIRGGTYPEAIDSNAQALPTGTSWSNAPLISAYPGETVTLRPTGCVILSLAHDYIQYLIFKNLIIDGASLEVSTTVCEDVSFGSVGSAINHVRFDTLEIKNSPRNGMALRGSDHEFINLHVHHNGMGAQQVGYGPGANGIYGVSTRTLFRGGSYHDNLCYGIREFNSGTGYLANYNVVENAAFFNNGRGKAFSGASTCGSGGGGIILGDQHNIARNNILYNNLNALTAANGGNGVGTDIQFLNNTVYGNTTAFTLGQNLTAILLANHIIHGNSVDFYNPFNGTLTVQTNLCSSSGMLCSLVGNPTFVNPAGNNYQLQSGSPAIDAGTSLSLVTSDFKGVARPQGGTYDIGAYEGTGTAALSAPKNLRVN